MGQNGTDQSADVARLITQHADKPARAEDGAALTSAWRWSQSGWNAEHTRSVQSLDAESGTADEDVAKD